MLQRIVTGLFALIICVAAVVRARSFVPPENVGRNVDTISARVSSELSNGEAQLRDMGLRDMGIQEIEFQRFDSQALVVMRCGVDGQPGRKGIDDNIDGVVDNASELGATGSDDVCVVEPPTSPQTAGKRLILQRGAYVPATAAEARDAGPGKRRAIVAGNFPDGSSKQTSQDVFSFLVDF